jgi:hypothetical protein
MQGGLLLPNLSTGACDPGRILLPQDVTLLA